MHGNHRFTAIRRRSLRFKGFFACLLIGGFAGPLCAATYKVDHLIDSWTVGDGCSLREAIFAHNSSDQKGSNECGVFDPGADTIEFASGVTGTLPLNPALGELRLTEPALTLQGPGASLLAISGGKVMSVLVLDLLRPPVLTVRALTIRSGFGSAPPGGWNAQGGGIRMDTGGSQQGPPTTIVVEDSEFFANAAPMDVASRGAAISSYGTLTLRRTRFRFNQSDTGALWHVGEALIEDCEFSDNIGVHLGAAAVLLYPGPWTVRRSLFRNNSDRWNGGAAINFFSNAGKGLVENCTFVGNSSSTGEVIYSNEVPITVRNSTFFDNAQVGGNGGSGAVVSVGASTLVLRSNLFANNDRSDAAALSVTASYNLFDTNAADLPAGVVCATTTLGGANLCGVTSPGIGVLSSNGGLTQTIPLLSGSPAINAGFAPWTLFTDQRGPGFARTVGLGTDIGAFEVQP